jgi:hypothetical protein
MRFAWLLLLMIACETTATVPGPKPTPTPTPITIDATTATAGICDVARAECLASRECTLFLLGQNLYECRPAQGPCEVDLVQTDRAACEARAQCEWKPPSCYCDCVGHAHTTKVREPPSGCGCGCGGGTPAMCVEKKG